MPNNDQDKNQGSSSNRGFASMDEEKRREAASKGGQQSAGNFANDPERASDAGRKGGQKSGGGNRDQQQRADQDRQNRQQGSTSMEDQDGGSRTGRGGNFADDPQRASEAGRKGGRS